MNQSISISNYSNLTVYLQFSEYIGLGCVHLFGLLATFEFAYLIAPRSAQSLFMSLYFTSKRIAPYSIEMYTVILRKHSLDLDFSVSMEIRLSFPYHLVRQ